MHFARASTRRICNGNIIKKHIYRSFSRDAIMILNFYLLILPVCSFSMLTSVLLFTKKNFVSVECFVLVIKRFEI